MKELFYKGPIPASKSLMNRGLLAQSYFPDLQIEGSSACEDVRHMKLALSQLMTHEKNLNKTQCEIQCGEAGTVLRFMALRASRLSGLWKLTGSKRLFERPQNDLVFILSQLGVSAELNRDSLLIHSQGWKKPLIPVQIHRDSSSQFASAVLLNSWNLPFSLELEMKGHGLSEGYWQMSRLMAENLGMVIEKKKESLVIPAGPKIKISQLHVEMDYSSGFVVAAAATFAGRVEITNCDSTSLQPDYVFIEALKKMGARIQLKNGALQVEKTELLKPLDLSLKDSPDLFPVLSVLCAFARGSSTLSGAPHLAHKESHRIKKTAELLTLAGVLVQEKADGLVIHGVSPNWKPKAFVFNPDEDHRMAMAAALLRFKSCPVKIVKPEVVNKSFPEFWKILGFSA